MPMMAMTKAAINAGTSIAAMCTNYIPSTRHEIAASRFGVLQLPPEAWPDEVYPGYLAPIVTRGQGDAVQCRVARFGLVPHWCKDTKQAQDISRKTYNARGETAAEKPSFRGPWHKRQWALAPMSRFFEPCWEDSNSNGGRAVRWQIARRDGAPFAVAGLWEELLGDDATETITSFTLLTVNADGHALMGRMHRSGDEKRMPVILSPNQYAQWLNASTATAMAMMQRFDARLLAGSPCPVASTQQPQNLSLF
jgi:putative SOS response-associated peptidase YedK